MIVYAVVYGNYYPAEVISVWRTKEQAQSAVDEANAEGRTSMWEIAEWHVLGDEPEPERTCGICCHSYDGCTCVADGRR